MRIRSGFVALPALMCLCLLSLASAASAAPPPNDNYLASTTLGPTQDKVYKQVHDTPDTAEATVQSDLFEPDKDGMPLGGAGPEMTLCNGVPFGKTIWYDAHSKKTAGGAQISAQGFDTVIALYRYDVNNPAKLTLLGCQNSGVGETLNVEELQRDASYTIQVGGVGGAGGPLVFDWLFLPDRDGDRVYDETPDECPTIKGPTTEGGCPPRLSPSVDFSLTGLVRFTAAKIGLLPKGTRVSVRCRRCGVHSTLTVHRANRRVSLRALVGRTAPNGAVIDVVATHPKRRSGRFQFGAIGAWRRYVVRAGKLVGPQRYCMKPGTTRRRHTCK